jgi:hypothetical protein
MPAVSKVFSSVPKPFEMPFFYASLSSLKVYCAVPAVGLGPYLGGTTLRAATFTDLPPDQGVVSVEFQNYTGHGGILLETCNEVEFNVLAYPASRADRIAPMSLVDFIRGMEQTKSVGGFRVYVPCDNDVAIEAGRGIFGEPKFKTTFDFHVPTPNMVNQRTWTYTVNDPAYPKPDDGEGYPKPKDIIYTVNADLTGLAIDPHGNPSPLVLYSMFPELSDGGLAGRDGYKGQRLIGSLWNIFDLFQTYRLDAATQGRVSMTFGKSKHPMRVDMEKIIGKAPPVCVQVYQSEPVAAENRAYFVDS